MVRTVFWVMFMIFTGGAGADHRIDLARFGRVVQYTGDSPGMLQVRDLERGLDGWEAWKGPDGQYMIGLEFDEPRDLREVGIEFRHAIADRHLIQVQYFKPDGPGGERHGRAAAGDRFRDQWVTARAEWWAGDRDVNFEFVPYSQERAAAGIRPTPSPAREGRDAPAPEGDVSYRRTRRIRFLLGRRELPPVRHIHAYGPYPAGDGEFDLQFEPGSTIRWPLDGTVVNGFFLLGRDRVPVTEMALEDAPAGLLIRYARGDLETSSRTIVTLRSAVDPRREISFLPAQAAKEGRIQVPSAGVTILHRGGSESQAAQTGGARLSPGT